MRKKLTLNPEDVSVQSFPTTADSATRTGTVRGFDASDSTCHEKICNCGGETEWDITCDTCANNCDTGLNTCPTQWTCPTSPGYQGC